MTRMSDAKESTTNSDEAEAKELHEDPELIDKDDRYNDRYRAARESANIDDHRDEPPNSS